MSATGENHWEQEGEMEAIEGPERPNTATPVTTSDKAEVHGSVGEHMSTPAARLEHTAHTPLNTIKTGVFQRRDTADNGSSLHPCNLGPVQRPGDDCVAVHGDVAAEGDRHLPSAYDMRLPHPVQSPLHFLSGPSPLTPESQHRDAATPRTPLSSRSLSRNLSFSVSSFQSNSPGSARGSVTGVCPSPTDTRGVSPLVRRLGHLRFNPNANASPPRPFAPGHRRQRSGSLDRHALALEGGVALVPVPPGTRSSALAPPLSAPCGPNTIPLAPRSARAFHSRRGRHFFRPISGSESLGASPRTSPAIRTLASTSSRALQTPPSDAEALDYEVQEMDTDDIGPYAPGDSQTPEPETRSKLVVSPVASTPRGFSNSRGGVGPPALSINPLAVPQRQGPATMPPRLQRTTSCSSDALMARYMPGIQKARRGLKRNSPRPSSAAEISRGLVLRRSLSDPMSANDEARCSKRRKKTTSVADCPTTQVTEAESTAVLQTVQEECKKHVPQLPLQLKHGVSIISCDVVARLVEGEYADLYDEVVIVDCRFPYEYEGGHIRGAVNLPTRDDLTKRFLLNPQMSPRVAVVFHCEYSQKRGPKSCRHMRSCDRQLQGFKNFPLLFYPELYVMEGGYKAFHTQYPALCEPHRDTPTGISAGYVPMACPKHTEEERKWQRFYRKSWSSSR